MITVLAGIFIVLLPVYVITSFAEKVPRTIFRLILRWGFPLLSVMALLAVWGHLSGPILLVSVSALPIGYTAYVVSLLISGAGIHRKNLLFQGLCRLPRSWKKNFISEQLRNIPISSMEEILFHGLLQTALNDRRLPAWICIVMSALMFVFAHSHQKKTVRQMLDLLVFSVSLSVYFQMTNDLGNCIVIHILRNVFIINESYTYSLSIRNGEGKPKGVNRREKL